MRASDVRLLPSFTASFMIFMSLLSVTGAETAISEGGANTLFSI